MQNKYVIKNGRHTGAMYPAPTSTYVSQRLNNNAVAESKWINYVTGTEGSYLLQHLRGGLQRAIRRYAFVIRPADALNTYE